MAADGADIAPEQVRSARHAYLANVSYIDSFVGQIIETLDQLHLADNTVVLFTADHGDMLGERGLWYKMNFFEASARVPMIINAPGQLGASQVATAVSLLDIAPTLLDLALVDVAGASPGDDFAGQSLMSMADADDPDRLVVGEYLGEGAVAPIFMLRRGSEKFVWSEADPPQLYDLASDPHELTNVADRSDSTARYEAQLHQLRDVEAINQAVLRSQQERTLVDRALRQGRYTAWDHQPQADASQQYMRNHLDLRDVEANRRL